MLRLDEEGQRLLEVLGNTSRLKILAALCRAEEELSIYWICRSGGLKKETVRHHLPKLVQCRLVSREEFGTMSTYKINRDNPKAGILCQFLHEILR